MSVVTTVMICGIGVYENAGKIDLYLESKDHFGLDRISGGGEKPFGVDVLQGALNYLALYSFIAFLESLNWEYPTDLFFMEEDDMRFTLMHLDEGSRREEILHRLDSRRAHKRDEKNE